MDPKEIPTEVLIEMLRNHTSDEVMIKRDVLENIAGRLEIYKKIIDSLAREEQ